jgi:hypothetical protein
LSKGVAVRRGARRIRACYPFDRRANLGWDKSLRTIFMDKNIYAYCGFMGLNSLVNFQPDTRCRCTLFLHRRKSAHAPERARILQDGA